jgi:hypothetical protein
MREIALLLGYADLKDLLDAAELLKPNEKRKLRLQQLSKTEARRLLDNTHVYAWVREEES